ncbi:pentapeptide repeat-containing protein [Nocardiopsis sp. ARC36]
MTSASPPSNSSWQEQLQERKARTVSWIEARSRALGWGGIIAGGICTTVAVWPLAITVWDVLGLADRQTWRLVLFGVGALTLTTGVVSANWKRASPVRLIWLILASWLLATATIVTLTGLAWLLLGTPQWQPPRDLTPRHLEAITTRAFAIVAGLGGVALLVIAYRRQRTTETGEQREVTKLFNERFTAAYTELGSEHAAVRLGAVHALAHLADDAPSEKEVQMVIDVLCAYLRMPYSSKQEPLPKAASTDQREEHQKRELEFASFREVRHTIIRIIGNHLRGPSRWRGKDFDFTGVVFDGGDLSQVRFTGGRVSFDDAEFAGGEVSFSGTDFAGATVSFSRTKFTHGRVSFSKTIFTGGTVRFDGTHFTGSEVVFNKSTFNGGRVSFDEAEFNGGRVSFAFCEFASGMVHFILSEFHGGSVSFGAARFTGSVVHFDGTDFSGAMVSFNGARFTHGTVSFNGADFNDGSVTFGQARFTSGVVHFDGTQFISGRVSFNKASGICPIKLLEAIGSGEPGVVALPDQWRPTGNGKSESPDAGGAG